MISLPLSSHFETSMSNLRFSTLNTSTCSRILALSCSGIFFIASRAVVMPDTSGYSSTSGPGSIKIRKIKIKSALVYFSTGLFNRSWRISTTPNTTKFFLIIFKLIQQAIMVILSCLAKKNQNLNSRKKVQFITESCVF